MSRIARTLVSLALFASLLLVAGCGKGKKVTAPPAGPGTIEDFQALLKTSYVPGMLVPSTVDGTADLLATMNVGGVRGAVALFQSAGVFLDAGVVTVHGQRIAAWTHADTLVQQSVPVNNVPFYVYSTIPSLPAMPNLPFTGTNPHTFHVGGSSSVPAFDDSILSVAMPAVATPAADASVPRADSLVVTWVDPGSDTTVFVLCGLRSLVDSTESIVAAVARDAAGRAVFPAARLGLMPVGSARLSVARYRVVHHVAGTRSVDLVCEAADVRTVTLADATTASRASRAASRAQPFRRPVR